jgi:hypothetical protein
LRESIWGKKFLKNVSTRHAAE